MDFKKHLETAWHMTLKHIVPLLLMTLVMAVLSAATLCILSPVLMAGYIRSIIQMLRADREPVIQDLFSEMRLFLPLLGFSFLCVIAISIGFMLLVLPGIVILLAITFGCLYVLPLMTDQHLTLTDAIKDSWKMATKGNIPDHIVVVLLFFGLISLGNLSVIGFLFTQPFATVFLISVYLERAQESPPAAPASPPPTPNGGMLS